MENTKKEKNDKLFINRTEDEKLSIWLHYVAHTSFLRNDLLEINVNDHTEKHFGKNFKKLIIYPNLLPNTLFVGISKNYPKPRDFTSFCNETDSRVSEGLVGYYWRFKDKIIL